MNEQEWGTRDARGEWQPEDLPKPSPLFTWPIRPVKILLHLWHVLWPYNLIYIGMAVLCWQFFTPSLATTKTFEIGWIAQIFARDAVLVILVASSLHLRLYLTKGQGKKFKYNNNWLAKGDKKFLFGNQTLDNAFWSVVSGCTVWTAWEAVTLWAYSNHLIPYLEFAANPVYFILLFPIVIYFRFVHFYFIHWAIHWKPLFKISHYLHHKNINYGPWTGLSMHPIEHLLYFSGVILHWFLLSNPVHAIFHLLHAGVSPILGHSGFHKLVVKDEKGILAENYFHYLHHRYFTVNYGEAVVPLDWWFHTYHDGSPESQAALMARRKKKAGKDITTP